MINKTGNTGVGDITKQEVIKLLKKKQDKIFTYTVANLSALNSITGMVEGNTAITLDTLNEYIYQDGAWVDALSIQILPYVPRVFYSFEVLGGVATFDNGANIINKNELLLCTSSDGSLPFNKGTQYQVDTTTATPMTAMLNTFLTPAQMVGKQLLLARDFNNYPQGVYTANNTQDDLVAIGSNVGNPTQANLTITSNNQTIFALPFLPKTTNITTLFLSGSALRYGVDYTISGSTLTYINSEMPLKTDYELYGIFYI